MTKMYPERPKNGNIPVMRFCRYFCNYCAFQKFTKISPCQQCRVGANHSHMGVLQRTPPKTKPGEFNTIGLSGDVSFMEGEDFNKVLDYCRKWSDRTFLIQSKNPKYFVQFAHRISVLDNVIIGTTLETNKEVMADPDPTNPAKYVWYNEISEAPVPEMRYEAMLKLDCRKAVIIEPVLDHDLNIMVDWICGIAPEFLYIGYANDNHDGNKLKLPEPALAKTMALITTLKKVEIEVREKTIRKAWWEEAKC
jgi:hypothetical protein